MKKTGQLIYANDADGFKSYPSFLLIGLTRRVGPAHATVTGFITLLGSTPGIGLLLFSPMSLVTMKKFHFKVYSVGCGAECLSHWEDYEAEGATKQEAQVNLAKSIGCCLSYLDEGEYCVITQLT